MSVVFQCRISLQRGGVGRVLAVLVWACATDLEVAADTKLIIGVARVALLDGAVAVDLAGLSEVDCGALKRSVDASAQLVFVGCGAVAVKLMPALVLGF